MEKTVLTFKVQETMDDNDVINITLNFEEDKAYTLDEMLAKFKGFLRACEYSNALVDKIVLLEDEEVNVIKEELGYDVKGY